MIAGENHGNLVETVRKLGKDQQEQSVKMNQINKTLTEQGVCLLPTEEFATEHTVVATGVVVK